MPEDSATLYIQFADAMLKVDPALKSGAPVFQGINQDASVWPGAHGNMSWFGRLYDYLKLHNRQGDLKLASFEIYPYEACIFATTESIGVTRNTLGVRQAPDRRKTLLGLHF